MEVSGTTNVSSTPAPQQSNRTLKQEEPKEAPRREPPPDRGREQTRTPAGDRSELSRGF